MAKEKSRITVLSQEQKLEMRIQDQYRTGDWTVEELARTTGLSLEEIEDIVEPYKDMES